MARPWHPLQYSTPLLAAVRAACYELVPATEATKCVKQQTHLLSCRPQRQALLFAGIRVHNDSTQLVCKCTRCCMAPG